MLYVTVIKAPLGLSYVVGRFIVCCKRFFPAALSLPFFLVNVNHKRKMEREAHVFSSFFPNNVVSGKNKDRNYDAPSRGAAYDDSRYQPCLEVPAVILHDNGDHPP